jgi:hypothetical protein
MELAIRICTRMAEGLPLTKVCRQAGMPSLTTVYAWRARHSEFDTMLRRARGDLADTLFAQAIEIADEKCVDGVAVQRNRLRVDARKWAAGKMNPRLYGDQLAIGGADDLPPVRVEGVEGAKRIAFALARAGQLLDQQAPAPLVAPPPAQRVLIEELPPYRRIMTPEASATGYELEEAEAEVGRIGDPARLTAEPVSGRKPLSAPRPLTNHHEA